MKVLIYVNYIKITKTDIANGPGVRVVLWVAGCNCMCKGCHNQNTWDFNAGKLFDDNAKNEIYTELSKPWIRGITLSGGHPLEDENCDLNFYNFIKEVNEKFPTKDIWLYTGWVWESIYKHDIAWKLITDFVDVVVDGPYIEELRNISLRFRGSENQRIIDVKKTLKEGKIICWDEING